MTTICRIEHSTTGWGLWKSQDKNDYPMIKSLSCYDAISDKHYNMPNGRADLGSREDNEFCAFKSIESLQEWVKKEWLQELIAAGFKILLLDVSECRIGQYQVLFKKEHVLQTKDITSLFVI